MANTNRQYKDSARFVAISILGIIALIILMTLLGGCAIKNETPKKSCCEIEKNKGYEHTKTD